MEMGFVGCDSRLISGGGLVHAFAGMAVRQQERRREDSPAALGFG